MRKRALVVNDSKLESLILRDMLYNLDYDVEMADEFDAMYEIEKFHPDVVIVNYIMKETTGDKLIKVIKDGQPEIKCLLSSSNPIKSKQFIEQCADGILMTPISVFTLKDVLRRISDEEPSQMNEEIELQTSNRNCNSCASDISNFGENIVFCPFCGDEINY